MKLLNLILGLILAIALIAPAHAQQNKADEIRRRNNAIEALGAALDNNKEKLNEIHERNKRENEAFSQQERARLGTPDQAVNSLIQINEQRMQRSKAFEADRNEMAAILAARDIRIKARDAGAVGPAVTSIATNGVATGSGGGISVPDEISIDDIGIAAPPPRQQTPIQPESTKQVRTCTCPVGTFEYYGIDCRSSKTYEIVTTKLGGYARHKNCGATYNSPEGDGL